VNIIFHKYVQIFLCNIWMYRLLSHRRLLQGKYFEDIKRFSNGVSSDINIQDVTFFAICLDATNNAYMKLHYEKFASNMKLHYEESAVLRRKPRPRHCTAPGDIFTPTRITPV